MDIRPHLSAADFPHTAEHGERRVFSDLGIGEWPDCMQAAFTDKVRHFESLERCLVWMTQQDLRFDTSPVPPWVWLAILELPAQAETLLDLCHTVVSQLPTFDITSRNRLIALFIDRFTSHGIISAIETVYRFRTPHREQTDLSQASSSSSTLKTSHFEDEGELAILRALQRLVSKTDNKIHGSQAQAEISRKLLATHVKHLAGTKSRLLTTSILDSLYFRKYLSKPLIKALETVRRRRKIAQRASWRRELFRYAVWRKDTAQSLQLLVLLQGDLACTVNIEERDKTYRMLLGTMRYMDPESELCQKIFAIQHTSSGSGFQHDERVAPHGEIAQALRIASSAYSRQVSTSEWDELCQTLPQDTIGDNLAVILRGYLVRDQATAAWRIWQRFYPTVEIESSVISAVLKVLARLHKIDEAVQLVDACSRLSKSVIDKKTVNGLLRICASAGRVDYFQRIWEAMEKRWNIRPDEIALSNMLLATRIAPESQITSFKQLLKRSFFSETSDIQIYDKNAQDPEPEGLAIPDSLPGTSANQHWWQIPRRDRIWLDWKNARSLFRHILFRNHPHLATARSPLDRGFASGIGDIVFGHRHSDPHRRSTDWNPIQLLANLPVSSRHNDITYTADTFHSYISLLNKHNLREEMALTLEWMKRLKIQPQRNSLCMVLLQVENSASPKQMRYRAGEQGWQRYALLTDGEWLRDWLVDWLGPKKVPTEDELADFHMHRWNGDARSRRGNAVQF